ncbi:beta-glucosidase [Deinococcus yavapaiensis]|uniref:Beta-glucosidase n=1 Tax=Deinococcus yavapaiensis KR-236 TaxID=694435 RepID=A0A318S2F8_9DEIO|nr:glycoside hydrolase family 3 C-terminal domain-containing protein [Deinococcus yavapaiensis]PYE51014.1 beta-glucosidase [Deinococcus yavapaiensis KR-236]
MNAPHLSWPADAHVNDRVERLLAVFTLEDKVKLVSGQFIQENAETIKALPGNVPRFYLADGPAGIRRSASSPGEGRATALPAPIALAATWNSELAARYGDVLGAEAAASGHNVLLGPAVDIARTPLGGRTFESFGEEPLLHARLVVEEVRAVQRHGVQASLKHFILNNQELARNSVDVRVGERALREVYLPPFEAAIRHGSVASIMASYNRVNAEFMCENTRLLTNVLRGEFGFRGWVVSDFGANHATSASANAGLDWELTFAPKWRDALLTAVRTGEVHEETLDEMVRRILRPTVGLGARPPRVDLDALHGDAHAAVALDVARESIVLLKNEALLPLDQRALRRVAVLGVDAHTVAAGGGSAFVRPLRVTSVVSALRNRLGPNVEVTFAGIGDPIGPGALLPGPDAVPSSVVTPPGRSNERGFHAQYWSNATFDGPPLDTRVDPTVELNRGFFDFPDFADPDAPQAPLSPEVGVHLSARWTGILTVPSSGAYTFTLTCVGSGRVTWNGSVLIDAPGARPRGSVSEHPWDGSGAPTFDATVPLTAGETHEVIVEYAADAPEQFFLYGAQVRFGWTTPEGTLTPAWQEAANLARAADVAVVVARTFESEAMDRPHLRLPSGQENLIRAVANANSRTIVVLMTGGPIVTARWAERVPAILEAWFGGQEQGCAVADVLLGDVNPSGRLPLTFPAHEASTPLNTAEQYPGVSGHVTYTEALNVGYRGYDALKLEPAYAFGFGLSYTTFSYANLTLTRDETDDLTPIDVAFDLSNTGTRDGTDVAQVYLSLPEEAAAPPKKLVGWARVALRAGETRRVTVTLDPTSTERPWSYWCARRGTWAIAPGTYGVLIGASSRDTRLDGTFKVSISAASSVADALKRTRA